MSERQIAWTILAKGHEIHTADGAKLGSVKEVIGDQDKDIFSGLTYSAELVRDDIFIPADTVSEITEDAVHLSLSPEQAEALQPYEG